MTKRQRIKESDSPCPLAIKKHMFNSFSAIHIDWTKRRQKTPRLEKIFLSRYGIST